MSVFPTDNASTCPYQDVAERYFTALKIKEEYIDATHNMCFCENCHNTREDNLYYLKGNPPEEYALPFGWVKFGLKVPPKAHAHGIFKNWHHAYHGTSALNVGKILETGDLLMPGDITPEGAQLRPPENHFDDKSKDPKLKPPTDHNIYKIFMSPSICYAGNEVYAPQKSFKVEDKEYDARVAFKVCVKPKVYQVGPSTIDRKKIDPKLSDDTLEWSTTRQGVTIIVGLLIKIEGYNTEVTDQVLQQAASVEGVVRQGLDNPPKKLREKAAVAAKLINYLNQDQVTMNLELFEACKTSAEDDVKKLLKDPNVDVNGVDKCGMNVLMHCSGWGRCNIVKILLAADGIDINLTDNDQRHAIHFACRHGHYAILQLLLDHGVNRDIASYGDQTCLIQVCRSGKFDNVDILDSSAVSKRKCVAMLLDRGVDISLRNRHGMTALHFVCLVGSRNLVKTLLARYEHNKDFNINELTNDKETPLYLAAHSGYKETLECLLNLNADPNIKTNEGRIALHAAVRGDHLSCIEVLIAAGSDVNAEDENMATPLVLTIWLKNCKALQMLVESDDIELEKNDNDGWTAMHYACKADSIKCLKALIKAGGNVDAINMCETSPLHIACEEGHLQCIDILINENADLNIQDKAGDTPIFKAIEYGHVRCIARLLRADPDCHISSYVGNNVLHNACEENKPDILKKLLVSFSKSNIGNVINAKNDNGDTPAIIATENGNNECLTALIKYGANLDMKNMSGFTALCLACADDQCEMTEALIKAKADLNHKNSDGKSAVMIAAEQGCETCVQNLIDAGADIDIEKSDSFSKSPIQYAIENDSYECTRMLLLKMSSIPKKRGTMLIELTNNIPIKELIQLKMKHNLVSESPESAEERLGDNKTVEDKRKMSVLPTNKPSTCEYQKVAERYFTSLNIKDEYIDATHNMCFCEKCCDARGDNLYYLKGTPPEEYALPFGWVKFGLKVPPKAHAQGVFTNWHHAYHGTSAPNVGKILETGDLLMPGDITPEGAQLRPPENHYDDESKDPKLKPPTDHSIYKIFMSPSICYAGNEVYAPKESFGPEDKKYDARVAFKVCVKPKVYKVGPSTIDRKKIDPKLSNKRLEWSTKRRGVTIIAGLLIKIEGYNKEVKDTVLQQAAHVEAVVKQGTDKQPKKLREKAALAENTAQNTAQNTAENTSAKDNFINPLNSNKSGMCSLL